MASRSVLVDTSAFFALSNRRDIDHARATQIASRLATDRRPLVTTNFVVAETHALLVRRLGRDHGARFLAEAEQGVMVVVRVDPEDEARAREIIRLHDDKNYALTDALSFAVMERLGIGAAFTFDRHFRQYGLVALGLDDVW